MDQATRSFFLMALFIAGAITCTAPLWFRDVVSPALEDALGLVPTMLAFALTGLAMMITTLWLQ